MKYEKAQIIAPLVTGTDSLGNGIIKDQVIGTYLARLTEWSLEERKILGGEITSSTRKCLVKFDEKIKKASKIVIDSKAYKVDKIVELGSRWYMLYISVWRLNG